MRPGGAHGFTLPAHARHYAPLLGFVTPTVVIGYGIVILRSCIAGVNELTVGFGTTILGAIQVCADDITTLDLVSATIDRIFSVNGIYFWRDVDVPRGPPVPVTRS